LCHQVAPGWTALTGEQQVRCHLFNQNFGSKIVKPTVSGQAVAPATLDAESREFESSPAPGAEQSTPDGSLLSVTDLKVYFPIHKGLMRRVAGYVKAVDGISLRIDRGKTLALVGESGCGKTTAGKAMLQLIPPTTGKVRYNGVELVGLERHRLRSLRSEFQLIFQDPYSSLNPRMRIVDIIEEGMNALGVEDDGKEQEEKRVDRLLESVGLPAETKWRYPHEFSGGQRQRIAIARALAVNPKLIVCDEPTSALDVSVQAQILNLLRELQRNLGLAYLFITHNISVVEYIADEVAVMYLGRIVERGTVDEVLGSPRHPYTQALLSAVPVIELESKRKVIRLHGDLPSPANPPQGCHFHPRCSYVMPVCRKNYPAASIFSSTHTAHCYLYPQDEEQSGRKTQA
jgi:peptide/nickel transport system ATP-binding protein